MGEGVERKREEGADRPDQQGTPYPPRAGAATCRKGIPFGKLSWSQMRAWSPGHCNQGGWSARYRTLPLPPYLPQSRVVDKALLKQWGRRFQSFQHSILAPEGILNQTPLATPGHNLPCDFILLGRTERRLQRRRLHS